MLDTNLPDPSSYRHAGVADISGGKLQPGEYFVPEKIGIIRPGVSGVS